MPIPAPPRDKNKKVIPHDNDGISDSDILIRRVSELQVVIDNVGNRRISSMAFKGSTGNNGGMSVDIEKLIVEVGKDPRDYVTTPRWIGSVFLQAGPVRSEEFLVGYDPIPANPYHGEIWGKFSKHKQRYLQSIAEWYVEIPGVLVR